MIYLHEARKNMWYRNRFIGVLGRGQKRDVVRQFYSNLQKRTQSRLVVRIIQARITVFKNLNSFYLMDRRHTLRQNKPQLNGKGLLQP